MRTIQYELFGSELEKPTICTQKGENPARACTQDGENLARTCTQW
eukprot:COSAG01_NODE_18797_length_1052_cov_3.080799_1_plen_44_part_10